MASKISPNPDAVAVVAALGPDNEVSRALAADFQRVKGAYDAWERQGQRNDIDVANAVHGFPGSSPFDIIRGWPYR